MPRLDVARPRLTFAQPRLHVAQLSLPVAAVAHHKWNSLSCLKHSLSCQPASLRWLLHSLDGLLHSLCKTFAQPRKSVMRPRWTVNADPVDCNSEVCCTASVNCCTASTDCWITSTISVIKIVSLYGHILIILKLVKQWGEGKWTDLRLGACHDNIACHGHTWVNMPEFYLKWLFLCTVIVKYRDLARTICIKFRLFGSFINTCLDLCLLLLNYSSPTFFMFFWDTLTKKSELRNLLGAGIQFVYFDLLHALKYLCSGKLFIGKNACPWLFLSMSCNLTESTCLLLLAVDTGPLL